VTKVAIVMDAERFPASGGLAGEGAGRLLGAPRVSQLAAVIRESLQNSHDAGTGEGPVRCRVTLRRLTADQLAAVRDLLATLPEEAGARERLTAFLASSSPLIMEISDWGTAGLGGPTRADETPALGETADFVNFVRNVGAARSAGQRGGTYGYGKSTLFRASGCATIVVDTLARVGEASERRLIACHVGSAYDAGGVRHTGRHWWGVPGPDGVAEPLRGAAAEGLASAMGAPERTQGGTGSTIMILDPQFGHDDLAQALGEIEEIMLWYFWPKMVDMGAGAPMLFELAREGEPTRPAGRPEDHPPLDLLVAAYRRMRAGEATQITSGNSRTLLGSYAVRQGRRLDRRPLRAGEGLIPGALHHIAVMRHVELVVRYYVGRAAPNDEQEWGGVFIADAATDVAAAFAEAEPPAHDDWMPEMLAPRSAAKTYVNVAIRELRAIAAAGGQPAPTVRPARGEAAASLAGVAEQMGRILPPAGAPTPSPRGGGRRVVQARPRVSDPQFVELVEGASGVEALFAVRAVNPSDDPMRLVATPGVVMDGAVSSDVAADDGEVSFLGWEDVDGVAIGGHEGLVLESGESRDVRARLSIPAGAAAGLVLSLEPDQ
jgi:hypothetical protein